jgi:cobalamin biosynthesis protein CobD/CbiB
MIFKSIFKGLFVFCVIVSVATWAAWIFAAIYRGFNPIVVLNSILMATLCLLLWMMVRRNECLIEEKNRWKKEYNDLVDRVFKGEFQEKKQEE